MTSLSPQAQAVLDAVYKATQDPRWQTNFYSSYAAAVLRAAADQVTPANGSRRNNEIRAEILAIAAELDGTNPINQED